MRDEEDTLEDELRELLTRVLQAQLTAIEDRTENLTTEVKGLSRICKDMPKLTEQIKELIKAHAELDEQYQAQANSLNILAKGSEALAQQCERLHSTLAETRTALSAQAQEGRLELVAAYDALAAQSKAQAEDARSAATRSLDTLRLALKILQQRADERSAALDEVTVRLAHSFDDKSAMMQSSLSALDRKIGLITRLSITVVIILLVAVIGEGAIYFGAR